MTNVHATTNNWLLNYTGGAEVVVYTVVAKLLSSDSS